MSSQIAPLLIDPLPTGHPDSVTAASRRRGAGGQTPGWSSASRSRWAGDGLRAIYPAMAAAACPVITKSAGTTWNGSPAGKDFG